MYFAPSPLPINHSSSCQHRCVLIPGPLPCLPFLSPLIPQPLPQATGVPNGDRLVERDDAVASPTRPSQGALDVHGPYGQDCDVGTLRAGEGGILFHSEFGQVNNLLFLLLLLPLHPLPAAPSLTCLLLTFVPPSSFLACAMRWCSPLLPATIAWTTWAASNHFNRYPFLAPSMSSTFLHLPCRPRSWPFRSLKPSCWLWPTPPCGRCCRQLRLAVTCQVGLGGCPSTVQYLLYRS